MKYLYLLLLWTCLHTLTYAQSVSPFIGARASSLGNATACLGDAWSVFNNIGGLAKVKETTAAFTYDARPALIAADRMAAVIVHPFHYGVGGFGLFRFGNDLYNEHIATLGFSNTMGISTIGARINYIQYSGEGLGTRGVVSVSMGTITQLTPRLLLGAHVVNINQPRLSGMDNERLPAILCAGLGIIPTDKLFITAEIEKNTRHKAAVKAGIEYKAHKKLYFRTGVSLMPSTGFFGIAFKPTKFTLDYAYRFQSSIGSGHQATIGYKFSRE